MQILFTYLLISIGLSAILLFGMHVKESLCPLVSSDYSILSIPPSLLDENMALQFNNCERYNIFCIIVCIWVVLEEKGLCTYTVVLQIFVW